MAAGPLYMALALLSFSLLGVFHKLADVKQCRPIAVNALLYTSSLLFVTLFVLVTTQRAPTAPGSVLAIALPFGICASVAILAFQAGIRYGNIATSWLAINLSAGIPTVASILIYGEPVRPGKAIALALIPISMFLLWLDKRSEARRVAAAQPPVEQAAVARESGS